LALLAALSLGPWLGSLRAHDELDGLAHRLDEAGSLRYRMLDLALVLGDPNGIDVERLRTSLEEQQAITSRLITGAAPTLPPCSRGRACERLRAHLDHVGRDLRPLILRAAVEPELRERATAAIRGELRELDDTVHLLAHVAQERVDHLVVLGRIAAVASLFLVALVGYGMWEVFSRIRRLEAAAHGAAPLGAAVAGPDEVAQLARTLSSTMRELQRYAEAERGRAERLLEQRRATRIFADDLRDWLAAPGSLDSAFARVARVLGLDAIWADERASGEPRLLAAVGLDRATWQQAVLPIQQGISGSEAAFAESGQSLDLSERIPPDLRAAGLRSLVLVPLTLGDERLGWMGMGSSHGPPAAEALSLGHLLAHGLTLAVVAQRLVREREQQAELAELLAKLPDLDEGAAAIGVEMQRFVDHEVALLCQYGGADLRDQTWRLEGGAAALLEEACRLPVDEVVGTQVTRICSTLPGFGDAQWLLAALRAGTRTVGGIALGRRAAYAAREVDAVERAAPLIASALERMRLEEQLRRAGQDNALAGMGRMVAHEVRNPLNNLTLHAHRIERLAARLPASEDRVALAGHASVLRGELMRLSGIVGGFLGMGQPPTREDTDLRTVVDEVCRVYAPALAENQVTVVTDLGSVPATASIDRPRILEVLENLLKNAIEALANRPERCVRISVRQSDGTWAIHVRDTGPGISSPERLFAPGYTTKPLGAGMGLAICRRTAQSHHGQLVARNAEAGGAEFVLTLPAAGNEPAGHQEEKDL